MLIKTGGGHGQHAGLFFDLAFQVVIGPGRRMGLTKSYAWPFEGHSKSSHLMMLTKSVITVGIFSVTSGPNQIS